MFLPLKVEGRSGDFPIVTAGIISFNCFIWLFMLFMPDGGESFTWQFAAIAKAVVSLQSIHPDSNLFPPVTLLTSQFLHADFIHLAGNMWFLAIFGSGIEVKLGRINFIIFYLACGVLSGITQIITTPSSTVPMLGASGAIAGVMGAFFLRYPKSKVRTLLIIIFIIRVVRIPAIIYLGVWLLFEILMGAPALGSEDVGVAHFAHIGGFLWGMIIFKFLEKNK